MKIKYIIALLLVATSAFAGKINDKQAVRAIVGEASSEPYECQLAIACVIRNRGSLKGVYGLNAAHVDKESKATFALATKAWNESATNNIVPTCKHWGGKMDKEYFEKKLKLKPVLTIGSTSFYP